MVKSKLFCIVLFLLAISNVVAQTHLCEKRIYLLDVTASMVGRGNVETPDIFDGVKKQLSNLCIV